jgi:plastocyanin
MHSVRALMVGLLMVVVGVAGSACGSSKKASGSAGSNGTTVDAADFTFKPKTLTAKAGNQVSFTFKNSGTVEHNFSVTEANVSADAEKGASTTVTFTAPAAGTYEFFCKYHKASQGMTGTLTVT